MGSFKNLADCEKMRKIVRRRGLTAGRCKVVEESIWWPMVRGVRNEVNPWPLNAVSNPTAMWFIFQSAIILAVALPIIEWEESYKGAAARLGFIVAY
jgi:hypothetical protein